MMKPLEVHERLRLEAERKHPIGVLAVSFVADIALDEAVPLWLAQEWVQDARNAGLVETYVADDVAFLRPIVLDGVEYVRDRNAQVTELIRVVGEYLHTHTSPALAAALRPLRGDK